RPALVVDLRQAALAAIAGGDAVVAQGAGQAHARQVGGVQQVVARAVRFRMFVGGVYQPVEPALLAQQRQPAVGRAAAAQRVARAVAEGADARAGERVLGRLYEARTVGHLAEVPAFADQLDTASRGCVDRVLQPFHR